jgi:hypothetical protein
LARGPDGSFAMLHLAAVGSIGAARDARLNQLVQPYTARSNAT